MGLKGTNTQEFANARARRVRCVEEYSARIARYRETVTRLAVAIVQGYTIAGREFDPADVVRDSRDAAKDLDAFYAECDALITAAGKASGLDVVEPVPAYITPGSTSTEVSAS